MDFSASQHGTTILWFFRSNGFEEKGIHEMFTKCKWFEGTHKEIASENWDYLKNIGIQERKLRYMVSKYPKILTICLNGKLVPMVECLATLGTKPLDVASAISKFPCMLFHIMEEKLCPLLAFFSGIGYP